MQNTELEKAVLISMWKEIEFSTNAHIAINAIQRHFERGIRGFCNEGIKGLLKKGYIIKKPTSGSMTYSLTETGVEKLKELLKDGK